MAEKEEEQDDYNVTVMLLDAVADTPEPAYEVAATSLCGCCNRKVWLGPKAAKAAIADDKLIGVCGRCAPLVVPEGTESFGLASEVGVCKECGHFHPPEEPHL